MKLSTTLSTVLAICGASCLWAGNGNAIDPTANAAVQYNFATQFGPTSAGAYCKNPQTISNIPTCLSQVFPLVPNGYRFVITSITGAVQYNPHGSSEVIEEGLNMLINVGGAAAPISIPFEHTQVVGDTTYYSFAKQVHMFMDPAIGFETSVNTFSNIGPWFLYGTGYMNITFQGYLVPLN